MKPFALPSFCYTGDTALWPSTVPSLVQHATCLCTAIAMLSLSICFLFVDYDTIVFIALSCLYKSSIPYHSINICVNVICNLYL